jgi:hypothetical protein
LKHLSTILALLLAVPISLSTTPARAAEAAFTSLSTALIRQPERSKEDFTKNNEKIWSALLASCSDLSDTTVANTCGTAAVFAASNECEASAKYFRKSAKGWTIATIALTGLSAVSTAVGASATIANAKIWSTLGGTTGLGAVSTTINSASTTDQSGLATVNGTLAKLQVFALGTCTPATPPTGPTLFTQARLYGAECAAAANSSSASSLRTSSN